MVIQERMEKPILFLFLPNQVQTIFLPFDFNEVRVTFSLNSFLYQRKPSIFRKISALIKRKMPMILELAKSSPALP